MLQSLFQRKKKSENNKILEFKEGFLVKSNKIGRTVVLDCINESNATLGERLNSLLDKKIMNKKHILIFHKIQKSCK